MPERPRLLSKSFPNTREKPRSRASPRRCSSGSEIQTGGGRQAPQWKPMGFPGDAARREAEQGGPPSALPLTSTAFGDLIVTVTAARVRTAPRSAALAATSGLALLVAAPAAVAAPDSAPAAPQAGPVAKADVALSPSVEVAQDASWSFTATEVRGEKPAPPPPPVVRQTQTASRAAARTAPTAGRAAAAAPAASVAPPSVSGNAVLEIAYRYLGVPYVWGGSTPAGFDCSGFTSYVYAQLGVSLPRSSTAQLSAGTRVSAAEARPGDLVGWPGHVGIYVGNGQYIGARQPGTPLKVGAIYHSNPIFVRVT
jgi:cell wall-associated NlpC family hydrolase